MSIFNKLSQTAFEEMQFNAGMILNAFNPADIKAPTDAEIICATSGGITINCAPTFKDWGEDVDNCPNNMKEYKHLNGWECTMQFTALSMTPATIALALGAAEVEGNGTSATATIKPKTELAQSDFKDAIWWVGDRTDGSVVAVKIKNALATSGLNMTTQKDGKGNLSVTLMGHMSVTAQDEAPAEFYICPNA